MLQEDEEIYRRLNIPWLPNEMQTIAGKQYRDQIEYMQEENDGLVTTNRKLREDLEEVNSHYQELITVSREALKRKRKIESQFTMLKQTIQDLQQHNEELTGKIASMETDQLKERRKAQALERIALLAEAAKDLRKLFFS